MQRTALTGKAGADGLETSKATDPADGPAVSTEGPGRPRAIAFHGEALARTGSRQAPEPRGGVGATGPSVLQVPGTCSVHLHQTH